MKKISIILVTIIFMFSAVLEAQNTINNTNNTLLQQKKAEFEAKKQEAEQKRIEIQTKKQQLQAAKATFQTKRAEYLAFKGVLNTKREELKANRDNNKKILSLNKDLRGSIRLEIKRIRDNKINVDSTVITSVNDKIKEVKNIISVLANTNGKITSLLNQNKDLIRNKDYVQMDIIYSEISEIQKARNNNLLYVNALLNDILNMLKGII